MCDRTVFTACCCANTLRVSDVTAIVLVCLHDIVLSDWYSLFAVVNAELGHFIHPCEDDLVLKCTNEKIPYFNAPLYFENKQQIGKVDEIFGPINDFVSFAEFVAVLYAMDISVVIMLLQCDLH